MFAHAVVNRKKGMFVKFSLNMSGKINRKSPQLPQVLLHHLILIHYRFNHLAVVKISGMSKEVQVEIDDGMTVRCLDITVQGTYDSYIYCDHRNV